MRVKQLFLVFLIVLAVSACAGKREITSNNVKAKKELSEDKEQLYYYVFLEANRKKLLGDLNGALALYYQCLEINPNAAAAMEEISIINEIMQNFEVAIKYANAAVESEPENKWYHMHLAKLYIVTNQYKEAIDVYKNIENKYPKDLEIPYNLATLYTRIGEYNKAIQLYDQIEEQTGINENISIRKQQLYLEIGQKSKAYKEIERLIEYYPNEPRFYGILAEMYTNDNLFLKAEENYEKLFEIDSTYIIGQLSIIDFYRKKMDYDNAFKMIKKVIYNPEIEFNQKVMVFVSMLNSQNEFTIYNQRIEKNLILLKETYPNEKDSYTLYADYLIKLNKLEEAKTEIEYILENYSGNIVIWEQLLSIYSYKNDFETLFEKSKVAIDSFPNHSIFYLFNGISANQINKWADAIQILKKGLKTIENNPELEIDFYTNLADAYHHSGDYKQSDYYFDLVLKRKPDNIYVMNNYGYYLSLRKEKLEYAESLSKKTIEAEPNNSTYLDTYAWILYKMGRYQDALYYITKAIENGGLDSNVIVEHYGDINYKVGNQEKALELWKLAKEMGNSSEELQRKIDNQSME
jgi:tetratricopeptide (TPR) repeat protein